MTWRGSWRDSNNESNQERNDTHSNDEKELQQLEKRIKELQIRRKIEQLQRELTEDEIYANQQPSSGRQASTHYDVATDTFSALFFFPPYLEYALSLPQGQTNKYFTVTYTCMSDRICRFYQFLRKIATQAV